MIIVNFSKNDYETSNRIWQYDYGQVLRIQGLSLPKAVEIDFSLESSGGDSITRIGVTSDNVTDVTIPDSLLENSDAIQDYNVYAFIRVTDTESGQTIKRVQIPVRSRPRPEAFDTPDDEELFQKAIEAVNSAAERAENAEQSASESATRAKQNASKTDSDRQRVEELVQSVSDIDENVATVKGYMQRAESAATKSERSEQNAKQSETNAGISEQNAKSSETNASQSATISSQAKELAVQAKNNAEQANSQAQQALQSTVSLSNTIKQEIQAEGSKQLDTISGEGTKQKSEITSLGEQKVNDITTLVQEKVNKINQAGIENKNAINTLSEQKIQDITSEGTEQVGLVTQEGDKQVQRVQEASQAIQDSAEQIKQNANDIVELYKEIEELDKKIESVLFAEYDGKVYSVFFEDSTVSMASTGEKEDDNAGIANPVPSTDTVSNENPYDSIPLFKPIECNGYVDEEGNPRITAIKGSPEFKEDGSNGDVCIALKTGYIRTIVDTDGSILGKKGRKVSVTDTWRESEYPNHPFVPYTGAIRLDGSVRPYILIPKYQAVSYNGSYYSLPGFSPVYNVSHNNQITTFQKRGTQYCGETNSDAEVWETLFEIVFATLNSQSIMAGCTSYNYQYQVTQTESNVKRVIVTNSQAANILIGSCVSIGDKGANSSVDRVNSYMHSLANRVLVTKKEALDDGANTAIYVNSPSNFTTTATTYISTMPWYTGATNSVKGTCGSPVDNLNGKYPFKFLGIEFALGQYIVRSDVIVNGVYDSEADTYRQDIYTCLDCTKFATSITSDYAKVGYSIPDTNVSWQYISDLGFDINNPHVRMAVKYGANSSQRYADGVHTGTRANGTREFLSLGNLRDDSYVGLWVAYLSYSLSVATWGISARPSYTGRRGTVADWASKNNISIGGVL